jgi:hypothetical protein
MPRAVSLSQPGEASFRRLFDCFAFGPVSCRENVGRQRKSVALTVGSSTQNIFESHIKGPFNAAPPLCSACQFAT